MLSNDTSPSLSIREELKKREESEDKRRRVNIELRLITQKEKELHTAIDEGRRLDCFQIINIIDNALDHINLILG